MTNQVGRRTLADQHGPWCAWCLAYFPPELIASGRWASPAPSHVLKDLRREDHHVVAKQHLPRVLERALGARPSVFSQSFPLPWTVDAHRLCHRLEELDVDLQDYADAATARLKSLASTVFAWDADEDVLADVDNEARRTFEAGLYSVAIFLGELLRGARLRRGERDAALEALEHQLSARAGVHGEVPLELAQFGAGARPRALLYLAAHQSNVGHFADAQSTFDFAQEQLGRRQYRDSADLELDLALRLAQLQRRNRDAEIAIRLADRVGTPYRQHTARVIAGMIALAEGRPSSQAHFESVLSGDTQPSWLYRAESWFGLGYIALRERKIDTAYKYLISSHYVYTVLGLQPTPHPALEMLSSYGSDCLPIDLLQNPQFDDLSKEACQRLRESAIADSLLRNNMFETLAGWNTIHRRPNPLHS